MAFALEGYLLTRHLAHLVDTTRAISAGNYDARVAIESNDEIGRLARHFNEMSDAVRARRAGAARTRRTLPQHDGAVFGLVLGAGRATPLSGCREQQSRVARAWFCRQAAMDLTDTNLTAEQWAAHRAQLEAARTFP